MNLIKKIFLNIKEVLVFMKDDFKSDAEAVKSIGERISHGEGILSEEQTDRLKTVFKPSIIVQGIKENWIWFILIFLALIIGWLFTAKYYQMECNRMIWENIASLTPNMTKAAKPLYNFSTF